MNVDLSAQAPAPIRGKNNTKCAAGTTSLELPYLAVVERLTDRGFGFASCQALADDLFFHISSDIGTGHEPADLKVGDYLICQIGTRPQDPERRCIVLWKRHLSADMADLGDSLKQMELDVVRQEALEKYPLDQLYDMLEAHWYGRQWGGIPPSDLQDSVLAQVLLKKISELSTKAMARANILLEAGRWPYDFAPGLDPQSPHFALADFLSALSPAQLAVLGVPRQDWLTAPWPKDLKFTPTKIQNLPKAGALTDGQKSAVLEWHLHATGDQQSDDAGWLLGIHPYEATLAQRLLAQDVSATNRMEEWFLALAENGLLDQTALELFACASGRAAALLFARLLPTAQQRAMETWARCPSTLIETLQTHPDLAPVIARHAALAVDLETDGGTIREIGCARGDSALCLYDKSGSGGIAIAIEDLKTRIAKASVLVGQNILGWDWPILAQHMPNNPAPLIWDTLLVQYLLDPAAPSHALGGTHKAKDDAEATLALFARQLEVLPTVIAARLIIGHFTDTTELLSAIINALHESKFLLARQAPCYLDDGDAARLLLIPEERLTDLDWVPGVTVVEIDSQTPLPFRLHEVDADRLAMELHEVKPSDPMAMVLLATTKRASAAGIAIRQNMIPLWIRANAPDLERALTRSGCIPTGSGMIRVSPMPQSAQWWQNGEMVQLRAVLLEGEAMLIERRIGIEDMRSELGLGRRGLLRCLRDGRVIKWIYPDQPARRLDPEGGWCSFQTICPPPDLARVPLLKPRFKAKAGLRPLLLRRAQSTLFPRSQDQASYWRGILRDLRALLTPKVVPILLIGSTSNQEMLALLRSAAAEIGLAEIKPDHRSRREHLLSAGRNGLVLLDTIESWRDWQKLADDCGLLLYPAIESAPIEEWFALAYTTRAAEERATKTLGDAQMFDAAATDVDPLVSFTESSLIEALPDLATRWLCPWLDQIGFSAKTPLPILLDARLETVAFEIRHLVKFDDTASEPWDDDERASLDIVFSRFEIEREEAPSDFASMETFLIENWQPGEAGGNQITGFKPTQTLAMQAIAGRRNDVMVALPTGEGKSVLFQVPALCRGLRNRRLTLVLSPLKALMRDQVVRLHDQGFAESVDHINSDRPSFELAEVMQGLLDHRVVMLYVAPERLRNARFLNALSERIEADGGLEYVVFDEAHCVNQWGYEFRPDYFHAFSHLLYALRRGELGDAPPFLLLSATLTASDRGGIKSMLDNGTSGSGKLPLQICPDSKVIANPLQSHIKVDPEHMLGDLLTRDGFETALAERLPQLIEAIVAARANEERTGQRSAVLIFVTRRAHGDELARLLALRLAIEIESYHAGLDAATREDVYHRFKDGDLNYLVATKAFGMGMDIPDIHWVIHLSPPSYLEDYLQEVGRIGRGVKERQRAGLNSLRAVLLASRSDFERMRGLRAMNELQPLGIEAIEGKILAVAEPIDGKSIALVPQSGFEPFESPEQMRANATRLRMALFWLEKAGHLCQLGMVPNMISAEIDIPRLKTISREKSQHGAVANSILTGIAGSVRQPARGLSGLGALPVAEIDERFAAAYLDHFRNCSAKLISVDKGSAAGADSIVKAVLNIAQIRRECGIASLDETMSFLAALQGRDGLRLMWHLEFSKRKLLEEPLVLIEFLRQRVSRAAQSLLHRLRASRRLLFDPKEFLSEEDWQLPESDASEATSQKQVEARKKRLQRAWINGFRSLVRSSSVRLIQIVSKDDGSIRWKAELPREQQKDAVDRCEKILSLMPEVLELILDAHNRDEKAVDVYALIEIICRINPKSQFRREDLFAVLRLLSAMNLVSVQPELVPLSHVIMVHDHPPGLTQHPELVAELAEVNALAWLRGDAMETFCHLPAESRETYVTEYFSQGNAADLKEFLIERLEEHEGEADDFFSHKLEAVRTTRVSEFFEFYQNSQEPAQWQAISHPYDQHLLVNAGPGAGKTSVLIGRITHLIREQHVKPSEIVVLAFNRAVVSEIKQRVRELFRSLGLGSYAARLRISTFHSLAARHLGRGKSGSDRIVWEQLLHNFATRLATDPVFRDEVADGCRAILIDEFQDVTEDVWSIVNAMHQGSGNQAGVMVIGDDDQDILRWQRKSAPFFAEGYFDLFRKAYGDGRLTELELRVNFRSGAEIVDLSQKMITGIFSRNRASRRLKDTQLLAAEGAQRSFCTRINASDLAWEAMLLQLLATCLQLRSDSPGSLAILCRTNEEVAAIQQYLAPHISGLTVQSGMNMRISALRHVALWLDFLEEEAAIHDRPLDDTTRRALFASFRQSAACPATDLDDPAAVKLEVLWDLCLAESAFPHILTLVEFIRGLQGDELLRLSGSRKEADLTMLSTTHKVKGLEYDNVIVIPSRSNFGVDMRGNIETETKREADAAEEARLFYVALTRAKARLIYFRGQREIAWGSHPPGSYRGAMGSGKILSGAPTEVAIGWSMQQNSFHPDAEATQIYIECEVNLGDQIVLGGHGAGAFRTLMHKNAAGDLRQIGFLASNVGAGNRSSDLTVSAVIRYSSEKTNLDLVTNRIAKLGWGYVVLVAGQLR